jgi:hypothetical protein
MVKRGVLFEVRTEFLYSIYMSVNFKGITGLLVVNYEHKIPNFRQPNTGGNASVRRKYYY